MRKCIVHFKNLPSSPYSQSAKHDSPMLEREAWDTYDQRTYLDHCTTNKDGQIVVPAMAWKQGLDTSAQKMGMKIPGRRGATFKSFFASGFFCNADAPIANGKPLTRQDADIIAINANSNGQRGSGSRVRRRFPLFLTYHGKVEFSIIDDIITPDVFEHHFRYFALNVGIGRFRPEKGGTNGRLIATKFEWENIEL